MERYEQGWKIGEWDSVTFVIDFLPQRGQHSLPMLGHVGGQHQSLAFWFKLIRALEGGFWMAHRFQGVSESPGLWKDRSWNSSRELSGIHWQCVLWTVTLKILSLDDFHLFSHCHGQMRPPREESPEGLTWVPSPSFSAPEKVCGTRTGYGPSKEVAPRDGGGRPGPWQSRAVQSRFISCCPWSLTI